MHIRIVFLIFFVLSISGLNAATFFVSTTIDELDGSCDDGDCSLRDAIALAGSGDIVYIPAGTYTTSSELVLNGETLIGENAATTIIQAAPTRGTASHTVFYINSALLLNFQISNLTIRHGVANLFAGGITIAGFMITATISNCIIVDNAYGLYGGGIVISTGARVTVSNTLIQGNTATGSFAGGGVSCVNGGKGTFINCVISGNNTTSSSSGGGLYVEGGTSVGTFINCTIAGNTASGGASAGALVAITGGQVILCNTLIAANIEPANINILLVSINSSITSSYSLIDNANGTVTNGVNGNIVGSSPIFVSSVPAAPSTGGNLRLQAGSLGIDAGNNGCSGLCTFGGDLDGNTRIANLTVDMGAYEYKPTSPTQPFVSTDASACLDMSSEVEFTFSGGTQEYTVKMFNTSTVGTAGVTSDLTTNIVTGAPMAGTYTYVVMDANKCSVTGQLAIGANCALPVELLFFKGQAQKSGHLLQWATVSEQNNAGFEVQRLEGQHWQSLGFVKGFGTTLEEQRYSFLDTKPKPGNTYYRLKQLDTDGTYTFSETIVLQASAKGELVLYPNPTSSHVQYQLPSELVIERLQLYDVVGRLVHETAVIDGRLSLENLAAGMYRLVVFTQEGSYQELVVKK